jgi:antitoxin component YwqK of YwqJK toxin-antitoxin module/thioredoxin-like negative regulator of GroEL
MRFFFVFVTLSLLTLSARAQSELQDSREIIKKGIDLYDKEEYGRAIKTYQEVHECDTNYALAVYEEVLALIADSQFVAAKQLAASSVGLRYGYRHDAWLELGNCYDYLGLTDSALMIYDSMMKCYPQDYLPHYEKGVAYFNKKNYDAAMANFQQALLINPDHFRSHFMLGKVYALQGRLTEAMMALETSLLCTKDANQAKSVFSVLSAIAEQTDEVKKAYNEKAEKYSNPAYDEIDQFINAKLAISSSYKLKITINDNVFRQTQMIMEKLKFDPSDTSFSMQFYVPWFAEANKQDKFEALILLMFSDFGLENVDFLAKHKKSSVEDARQIVFPVLNEIRATRQLIYNKRKESKHLYHYFSESQIIIVGETNEKGDAFTGPVKVYKSDQSLLAEGSYNEKGKTGLWKYYYKTGKPMKTLTFKDDKEWGTITEYYDNGEISKITTLDDKGETATEETYNYRGWKSGSSKVVSVAETEESSYHQTGAKEVTINFANQHVKDGEYTFYYDNGKMDKVVNFKNGTYNGKYKKYYENGTLNEESVMENGKVEGKEMIYFEDGKLHKEISYHGGKLDGPYTFYYNNGKTEETGTYRRDKKTGVAKRFTKEGWLYAETEYDDNVPVSVKFMAADGKPFYTAEEKRGIKQYTEYYADGNKAADMELNGSGQPNGRIIYYDHSGNKATEVQWVDGAKDGRATVYYKNGKVKMEQNYVHDVLDGFFRGYHENGVLQTEGCYKEGKKEGLWKYYFPNGAQQYEGYFAGDDWNGYYREFNISGKLETKYIYDKDMLVAAVLYDTTGRKIDSICYPHDGKYAVPNRITKGIDQEGTLRYGSLHGKMTTHHINGAVWQQQNYRYGKRDSLNVVYYPNGAVESKLNYKKGELDGNSKNYNEIGEEVNDDHYVEGSAEGYRLSSACGRVFVKYHYSENEKDGEQVYYGEDGKVAFVLYYTEGCITGYSYMGKDGNMLPMTVLKNGSGQVKAFYPNGAVAVEAAVEKGIFNGPVKVYYSNGKPAEERKYKMDMLNGTFKRYMPDGKLIYELDYKDDREHGVEKTYDKNGVLVISKEYYYGVPHGNVIINDPVTRKTTKYVYNYGELINVKE